MSSCLNTLQLIASAQTTQTLIHKGCEDSDMDDWGFTPQQFSFRPFVFAVDQQLAQSSHDEIESIWTNWIATKPLKEKGPMPQRQQLSIEFESNEIPPVRIVQALADWLEQEGMPFELHHRFCQENKSWQDGVDVIH